MGKKKEKRFLNMTIKEIMFFVELVNEKSIDCHSTKDSGKFLRGWCSFSVINQLIAWDVNSECKINNFWRK